MQPPSGQIDSGEETTPTPTTRTGRGAHMRTIQPINDHFTKPKLVLDSLKKPPATEVLQPATQHPVAPLAPAPNPIHDDAAPHPVAPREPLTPPTPSPSPTPVPIAPQPIQQLQSNTPPTAMPVSTKPLQAAVAVASTPAPRPMAPNPLPAPVQPPIAQQNVTQTPETKQTIKAAEVPPQTKKTETDPKNQPGKAASHPLPTTPRAPAHTYTIDTNESLMRSSNPLAATLSGIELLIKRNGVVAITYVSIFVGTTAAILATLYAIGRFGNVEFLKINFTLIAALIVGLLLNVTYLVSFIVCVASEAGQSISLRQISYLARQSLHKLLALQIITIAATFGGLLLGIIPGVIILGRWMMAPFMIFESDHPSTITAIKRSNKLTKGRTIEMTGLVFTQVLLLSTGLLGFAAMAAGPAARYQQLRMRLHDSTAVSKVHILNYIMSILLALSLLAGMTATGYQIYKSNQTVCYSTIKFVSGRPSPVQVCVKRHVCIRDIVCRETLKP